MRLRQGGEGGADVTTLQKGCSYMQPRRQAGVRADVTTLQKGCSYM